MCGDARRPHVHAVMHAIMHAITPASVQATALDCKLGHERGNGAPRGGLILIRERGNGAPRERGLMAERRAVVIDSRSASC
jgi:hypothetical protein